MIKNLFIILMVFVLSTFSVFAGTCPTGTPASCPSFGSSCSNEPTILITGDATESICYATSSTTNCCHRSCAVNATYNGTNCACDSGYGGDGTTTCEQCTAGNYGPNSSNACVACPTEGGSAGTSVAGSDVITDCYKTYISITNGHLSGTCYYSTGTYLNVSGTCILTCDSGYSPSGTSCNPNTYTITLTDGTGASGGMGTIKEVYNTRWTNSGGTTITSVTVPIYTGHTFTGYWTESSGGILKIPATGVLPSNTTFYADTDLWAQWSATPYNIVYNSNGGTCPDGTCTPTTYNISSPIITLPIPTRSGYIFNGWYGDSGFSGSPIQQIPTGSTGDKEFWARWTACNAGQWVDTSTNSCIDCTAGHYCPLGSTSPSNCPMGHTSDIIPTLPDAITDCYITTGPTAVTKFCEDGGARCFYLPDVGNIQYH